MLLKLAWVKNLTDQSIESVTSLYRCVNSKTAISGLSSDILDCDPLRAYLVFLKFGLVHEQLTCEHCGRPSKFVCRQRTDGAYRIEYHCPGADADKNWRQLACHGSPLVGIRPANWFPYLQFLTMMRTNQKFSSIQLELKSCGISRTTCFAWKEELQSKMHQYLEKNNLQLLGGQGTTVVVDETQYGRDRKQSHFSPHKRPAARGPLSRSQQHIRRRLPAKTIWKQKSIKRTSKPMKKTRFYKKKANTANDKRHNSRWIWVGVEVGRKGNRLTHANKSKRVSLQLLPSSKRAPDNKPRGVESLAKVIKKNVRPKTGVVSDEWRATSSAVKTAGSKIKGSVSHVKGFRCDDTGFHGNDAESEIARFKLWARQKYAYCRGSSAKSESLKNKHYKHMLAEYCFYVNVGSSFRDVCKALALESA